MLLILSVFSFENTHCSNFDWISVAWSVPTFIVTITTLIELSHPLISRPDLFFDRKYLGAPTFETSVQRVFKAFLWLFKLAYNTFHLFPG